MSYNPVDWKDRIVEKPRTYYIQNNPDGTVTLIPAPGTVVQEGTPVNAANLNHMEQGFIAHLAEDVQIAHPPHKHDVYVPLVGLTDFITNGEIIIEEAGDETSVPFPTSWTTIYDSGELNALYTRGIHIAISVDAMGSGSSKDEFESRLLVNNTIVKTLNTSYLWDAIRLLGGYFYDLDDGLHTVKIQARRITGGTGQQTKINSIIVKGNIILEGIM